MKALDGEIGLDRVEHVGVLVEQMGETAGGDDRDLAAYLAPPFASTNPSIIAT